MKIDFVIITHFDSDHVNGIFKIIENLKIEEVLIPKQLIVSENYEKFLKTAKERKLKVVLVQAGEQIKIDKNVYINVLWPKKEIKENVLNNNSIVFNIKYNDFKMLFTSDIEKIAEERILKEWEKEHLKANILKVAHHGSNTSSCVEFIQAVQPEVALIGVGLDNKFGHPSINTINTLKENNIKIYRTDIKGEIKVKINKKGKIKIKCIF